MQRFITMTMQVIGVPNDLKVFRKMFEGDRSGTLHAAKPNEGVVVCVSDFSLIDHDEERAFEPILGAPG
jgi:hypothetical protein